MDNGLLIPAICCHFVCLSVKFFTVLYLIVQEHI